MALPKSYLTSTKNLKSILQAIQSAQAPEKFNVRFLENLGFSSSNDRLIVGVLRELGFLDPEGRPTERYFRYLDATQAPKVMAEGVRDAYDDLFSIKTDAHKLQRDELINKAKTLSQGSLSESVLEKFALTFQALVSLSDFSETTSKPKVSTTEPKDAHEEKADSTAERKQIIPQQIETGSSKLSLGGLHYNFQIILPPTRDPAVYDAIFRSLKEHLLD